MRSSFENTATSNALLALLCFSNDSKMVRSADVEGLSVSFLATGNGSSTSSKVEL